jgi:hypothetical protein
MTSAGAVHATREPECKSLQSTEIFVQTLYGTDPPGFCNVWTLPGEKSHFIQANLPAVVAKTALQLATNHDVYLGLGLLREPLPGGRRGCKEDVIGIPGFWADIDIKGPGHKQAALPETQEQAVELAYSLPWEPTLIVFSGGGIYGFWLFKEPWIFESDMERERAAILSSGFQTMLIAEGHKRDWVIDNTSDLPRVLRVVGTYNRKQEPILVRVIEYHPDRRYSPSDLEEYIPKDSGGQWKRNQSHKDEASNYPPADIEKIVAECPWMRHCRDDAASLPEPEWYSMLSIVGHCENGPRIAHDWSQKHPGYSTAETDKKLDHALADGGPRKCENIRLNGGIAYCEQCRHAVVSPITLGYKKRIQPDNWPDPVEPPALLPEAPALPPEMIPDCLRGWMSDLAERMQIPLEIPGAAAIVGLASVIGRKVAIHPKRFDDWLVFSNLWGAAIARPGMMKSAGLAEALKPLGNLVAASRERFNAELKSYRAAAVVNKARIEATRDELKKAARKKDEAKLAALQMELESLQSHDASSKPIERRYRVNDATVEKLLEILRDNPMGLLLFRDELGGWLCNLDRSGREGDREFYLESWTGDGAYTTDRIQRGTINVDGLCLSIFGGIQPAKLNSYIEEALNGGPGDDGLIQRFQLMVYPEINRQWVNVDRWPERECRDRAHRIFLTLDSFKPEAVGITPGEYSSVPALHFDDDAQRLFDDWRCHHEIRLRSGELSTPAFESHLAKYPSLMASLALIFHLAQWADSQSNHAPATTLKPIAIVPARLAAEWCEYLELHARKVYAGAIRPDIQSAHALAAKIREGKVKDKMPMRDLYRAQWSNLRTKQALYEAAAILDECGWTRIESIETERKPMEILRVNPKVGGKP